MTTKSIPKHPSVKGGKNRIRILINTEVKSRIRIRMKVKKRFRISIEMMQIRNHAKPYCPQIPLAVHFQNADIVEDQPVFV
jgi:hypothetical protein